MAFLVSLETRAVKELQDAIHYYDEQQSGLGKKFAADVDRTLIAIANNPFIRYDTALYVVCH